MVHLSKSVINITLHTFEWYCPLQIWTKWTSWSYICKYIFYNYIMFFYFWRTGCKINSHISKLSLYMPDITFVLTGFYCQFRPRTKCDFPVIWCHTMTDLTLISLQAISSHVKYFTTIYVTLTSYYFKYFLLCKHVHLYKLNTLT